MSRNRLLIVIVFSVFLTPLYGQSILEINDRLDELNFMPYELNYFIDTTNALTFAEISGDAYARSFQANALYQNKDFRTNSSYWIKLPVRHTMNSNKVWLLEFYDQTIDYLDAYIPQEDGSYKKISMGDILPFSQRVLMHKNSRSYST